METAGTSSIQEATIVGMPNSPDAIHKSVYFDSSYSPNVVRYDKGLVPAAWRTKNVYFIAFFPCLKIQVSISFQR